MNNYERHSGELVPAGGELLKLIKSKKEALDASDFCDFLQQNQIIETQNGGYYKIRDVRHKEATGFCELTMFSDGRLSYHISISTEDGELNDCLEKALNGAFAAQEKQNHVS
jgi:hypothetical protein